MSTSKRGGGNGALSKGTQVVLLCGVIKQVSGAHRKEKKSNAFRHDSHEASPEGSFDFRHAYINMIPSALAIIDDTDQLSCAHIVATLPLLILLF